MSPILGVAPSLGGTWRAPCGDPAGPFEVTVAPRRTKHLRFDDLTDPAPIPRETDFSTVIESSVPIVVQHTRLDGRDAVHGLITTIAYFE